MVNMVNKAQQCEYLFLNPNVLMLMSVALPHEWKEFESG